MNSPISEVLVVRGDGNRATDAQSGTWVEMEQQQEVAEPLAWEGWAFWFAGTRSL